MKLSNEVYDFLKILALVFAPFSVFIVAVLTALEITDTQTVTAILAAFNALLGSLVEVARRVYMGQLHDDERN